MKKLKEGELVFHIMYDRGEVVSVSNNIVKVKYSNNECKEYTMPNALNKGEIFKINENNKYVLYKTYKNEFKDFLKLRKELKKIDIDEYLLIDLYKKYENEYLLDWILYDVGRVFLNKKNGSVISFNKEHIKKLLLLLTIISYYNYDGEIWNSIKSTLKPIYDLYSTETKLENEIRQLIDANEKYNTVRQITNPLVHSLVPKYYLQRFIDFVFDIYLYNFNAEINDLTIDLIVRETINGIVKTFSSNNDELFSNVTNKTYILIESTKLALKHYPKKSSKYIVEILKIIDAWYHNRQDHSINDKDLMEIFNEWKQTPSNEDIKDNKKTETMERVPRAVFNFNKENNLPYIRFPEIPLRDEQTEYEIRVEYIIEDNKRELIYNEDYYTEQKIGVKMLHIKDIKLENPLSNIRLKVYKDEKLIYDTEESLFKDYLLFNSDSKEISNNKKYEGIAFIVFNKDTQFNYGNNIYTNNYIKVNAFDVREGNTYELGNTWINFNDSFKLGIYGEEVLNTFIKKNNYNNKLTLYKRIDRLIFETNELAHVVEVKINNRTYKLENLNYELKPNKINNRNTFILNINEDLLTKYENNIRIIANKEVKQTFKFFYDKSFNIQYSQINNLIYDVDITTYDEPVKYKNIDFSKAQYFEKEYFVGRDKYTYVCNPNILRYKIADNNNHDTLSYLEMNDNNIHITKSFDKVEVRFSNGEKYDDLYINKRGLFETIINVSNLRTLKKQYNYLNIVLIDEGTETVIKLYLKETIIGKPILKLKDDYYKLMFNIKCFESGKLNYEITTPSGKITKNKLNKQYIKIHNYSLFNNIEVLIYREENIFSGDEYEELYFKKHFLTDTKALDGKMFNIRSVVYSTYNLNNERKERQVIPTKTYIKFVRKMTDTKGITKFHNINLENDVYIIELFKHAYNGRQVPFKIKKRIYAEVISQRHSNILILYTEDYDAEGLQYDKNRNFILEYEMPNAELIDYITVNLKEMV